MYCGPSKQTSLEKHLPLNHHLFFSFPENFAESKGLNLYRVNKKGKLATVDCENCHIMGEPTTPQIDPEE